jgi:hypothetical protein
MLAEPANANDVMVELRSAMRIFIFKSEARPDLHAFGPSWTAVGCQSSSDPGAIGAIAPDRDPPHELSREAIEQAMRTQGFQLWRMSRKEQRRDLLRRHAR